MDLDELKRAWQRSTTGNWTQASGSRRECWCTSMLAQAETAMRRLSGPLGVESVLLVGIAVWLGSFIWQ